MGQTAAHFKLHHTCPWNLHPVLPANEWHKSTHVSETLQPHEMTMASNFLFPNLLLIKFLHGNESKQIPQDT